MTPVRYKFLEVTGSALTKEEADAGWHYCPDWDQMLIHPKMPEGECCTCPKKVQTKEKETQNDRYKTN